MSCYNSIVLGTLLFFVFDTFLPSRYVWPSDQEINKNVIICVLPFFLSRISYLVVRQTFSFDQHAVQYMKCDTMSLLRNMLIKCDTGINVHCTYIDLLIHCVLSSIEVLHSFITKLCVCVLHCWRKWNDIFFVCYCFFHLIFIFMHFIMRNGILCWPKSWTHTWIWRRP